jgi:aromatic ring-opening dioxygenase LigB subunit
MLRTLPKWYSEAERQLNKVIDNIIKENNIDWYFSHDSQTINNSKENILMALVAIFEQVNNPMNPIKEDKK